MTDFALKLVPGPDDDPAPPLPADVARGLRWIDLEAAARRSGLSAGQLRRLCLQTWSPAGKARKAPSESGQTTWEIHESADARLLPVKSAEALDAAFDVRTLSTDHRRQLLERKAVVDEWELHKASGIKLGFTLEQVTGQFLQRLELDRDLRVSRATLYNWSRDYRSHGLAGLVDKRWRQAERAAAAEADPFYGELRKLYLDPRKRSKQLCYDRAVDLATDRGWDVPSYRTACRHLDAIPAKVVKLRRGGEEEYAATAAPHLDRDYTTIDTNDVWVGDHHQLDVMVEHDGKILRPWLTAWLDMRSRYLVGWRLVPHAGNSDTILAAFRDGVKEHGVPRSVYIDNGKDYDAFALQGRTKRQRQKGAPPSTGGAGGVFGQLGVDVQHAQPYRPQSKSIERFFGTVCRRFSPLFDTYCGNHPGRRPEDLSDQVARGKAPTLAEFAASFGDWLDADYHHKAHDGDGMDGRTPADVFAACLVAKRTAPAGLLDVLALRPTPPVKVGRNGVTYAGLTFGRGEPALWKLQGREVVLRVDDNDLSQVQVYDAAGRFLCLARVNGKIAVQADSQDLREAIAEQKRDRQLTKKFYERRVHLSDPLPDRVARKAAAKRASAAKSSPDRTQPPPSISPVRSPLEDQLPALQRALDSSRGKVAVGAEALDLDALRGAMGTNDDQDTAGAGGQGGDAFLGLRAALRSDES